jgi:hypothetical protein
VRDRLNQVHYVLFQLPRLLVFEAGIHGAVLERADNARDVPFHLAVELGFGYVGGDCAALLQRAAPLAETPLNNRSVVFDGSQRNVWVRGHSTQAGSRKAERVKA